MDSLAAISTELAAKNISYWSWAVLLFVLRKRLSENGFNLFGSNCGMSEIWGIPAQFLLSFFINFLSPSGQN